MYAYSAQEIQMNESEATLIKGCINLLIRVLPFIFTSPDFADNILWNIVTNPSVITPSTRRMREERAKKAAAKDKNKEEGKDLFHEAEIDETKIPYAIKLLESIFCLCFKPGFTINEMKERERLTINPYGIDYKVIWRSGVACENASNTNTRKYDKTRFEFVLVISLFRIDILKLLIVALSETIYLGTDQYLKRINPFITFATNSKIKHSKNLFFSLLNTMLTYDWKGYVNKTHF